MTFHTLNKIVFITSHIWDKIVTATFKILNIVILIRNLSNSKDIS